MSDPNGASQANDVPRSDALVIFGFTGDLAGKKILPVLYAMEEEYADRSDGRRRIV